MNSGPDITTSIFNAVRAHDLPTVDEYLESSGDVDARDSNAMTALLLAGGAVLNIRARKGLTALQYATENGAIEVARILAEAGDRQSATT